MTIGVQPDVVADIPYEQIKEITGCDDINKIKKVWNNCSAKGNNTAETITADVISSLCENRDIYEGPLPALPTAAHQNRPRSNSMETQTGLTKPMIDLTNDNDDIQKAIAASLENPGTQPAMLGGQITREDQDISRVLEASLADTKSDGKKNPVWYIDHANPHERKRDNSWPVGLKNVGNTCWFNAVIQSLFHIETFRELILGYEPSEELNKDNQVAVFMVELKRLFSLMLASDRKYLNPSTAIEVLKHSFSSGQSGQANHTNGQQDVSEFQHKLLDWLEEAFQHWTPPQSAAKQQDMSDDVEMMSQPSQDASTSSAGDNTSSPMDVDGPPKEKDDNNAMVKLFYGKVRTYGTNAGETFTTHTHFGQWPLYVAGFSDIHQSLEAGLAQGDIETNNTDQTSNQEQWFSHLPPLLTFELSRFSYNTMQSQAEKLHNKFSFPQTLYLDRYLEQNKDEVRAKRDKLMRLRRELLKLETNLQKYTHYGSGERKYPLSDILNYSLEFAMSSSNMPQPCPLHTPQSSPSAQSSSCDAAAVPRPQNISEQELAVLSACINRWKDEVKVSIAQYEHSINSLKDDVTATYEQEHLKMHKYCLHAVMVHEGEAISGHYWSYVFNREANVWLKFNDISVTETSWEEVARESEGGSGTASAYCLIYTQSADNAELYSQGAAANALPTSGHDFPSKEESLARLPDELQAYVLDDNQKLQDEILQWDASKALIAAQSDSIGGVRDVTGISTQTTPDIVSSVPADIGISHSGWPAGTGIKSTVDELANEHAQSLLSLVRSKYPDVSKSTIASTWHSKFELLVKQCYERYLQASKDLSARLHLSDTRTHLAIYLLVVYGKVIDPTDVQAIIADQVTRLNNTQDLMGWTHLQREAAKWTLNYYNLSATFRSSYAKWHEEHHRFRIVLALFVDGIHLFNQQRYEDALPLLYDAYVRNTAILQSGLLNDGSIHNMRGVDMSFIAKIRNQCIERFNDMALTQFETEDDYRTPLRVMLEKVLPVLDTITANGGNAYEDNDFVGSIKNRWVNEIGNDTLDPTRAEAVSDFIGSLFEPATTPASDLLQADDYRPPLDIGHKYKQVMQTYSDMEEKLAQQ